MFNEKELETRLPHGKLSLMSQVRFIIRLLAAPSKEGVTVDRRTTPMKKFVYAGLCAFAFLLVGGVWAYSSPSVTSGDALFAVKGFGEGIALASASKDDKAEVWASIAERRLAEFEYLSGGKVEISLSFIPSANAEDEGDLTEREQRAARTLDMMKEAFDKGMSAMMSIADPVKIDKIAQRLEKFQVEQRARLEAALDKVADDSGDVRDSSDKVAQRPFGELMAERIAVAMDDSDSRADIVKKLRDEAKKAMDEKRRIDSKAMASSSSKVLNERSTAQDVAVALEKEKEAVVVWKESVTAKIGSDAPAVVKLFSKIDDRLAKAERALDEGKVEQSAGLLKSVRALENNAKHLMAGKELRERMQKAKEEVNKHRYLYDRIERSFEAKDASSTMERLRGLEKVVESESVSTSTKARLKERIRSFEDRIDPRVDFGDNGVRNMNSRPTRALPATGPKIDVRPIK